MFPQSRLFNAGRTGEQGGALGIFLTTCGNYGNRVKKRILKTGTASPEYPKFNHGYEPQSKLWKQIPQQAAGYNSTCKV
jgi:hypothetical protein